MRCDIARDEFSALLDGELDGSLDGAVRAHLESCEPCRTQLAGLEVLSRALATRLEPDPGFIVRFRARRDREIGDRLAWLPWRRLAFRLVPLAAAAVLAVAAGVWISAPSEPAVEMLELVDLEYGEWGSDQALADEEFRPSPVLHIAMEPFPGGLP
jgi:anti-sigma factor RsiW